MEYTKNLKAFTDGYVECALWAGLSEEEETKNDGPFTDDDLAEEAKQTFEFLAKTFLDHNADLLALAVRMGRPYDHLGHDLFLTRNGHGTGFWDRDLGELGDMLTERAGQAGECELYVGDGGLVYVS